MMNSTPRHPGANSESTSPTAVTLEMDGGESCGGDLRKRARGKTRIKTNRQAFADDDDIKNPKVPLLPAAAADTPAPTSSNRLKQRNLAAKRPGVDVRKLGNFKKKIGMLQDSRNLRFRKIYKAPDPIVIVIFVGSILLWYVLFNYLKTWK